jgi:hypothetical protein
VIGNGEVLTFRLANIVVGIARVLRPRLLTLLGVVIVFTVNASFIIISRLRNNFFHELLLECKSTTALESYSSSHSEYC